MKTPGPQNPGANRSIRKREKKSLLPLGGLLLGSRLLSSLLLRGHDGAPPSLYFGPDDVFVLAGPNAFLVKVFLLSSGRPSDGKLEKQHILNIVIVVSDHLC